MFPRSVAELGPRSEKPSDIQLFPTSDPRVKPEDDGEEGYAASLLAGTAGS